VSSVSINPNKLLSLRRLNLSPHTEVASGQKSPHYNLLILMLERSAGCIGYANHFDEHTEQAISHFLVHHIIFRESLSQNDDSHAPRRFPSKPF
jgi:hypothetical protein